MNTKDGSTMGNVSASNHRTSANDDAIKAMERIWGPLRLAPEGRPDIYIWMLVVFLNEFKNAMHQYSYHHSFNFLHHSLQVRNSLLLGHCWMYSSWEGLSYSKKTNSLFTEYSD